MAQKPKSAPQKKKNFSGKEYVENKLKKKKDHSAKRQQEEFSGRQRF